ncbi:MAG: TetR/AcrR family transcriptional regulator [Oleispira sp.]|nr:TetR/AcrR family transcriptional regulator [Oleispira sp.]
MPKPSRAEAKQASRDALIKSAMELMPEKGIDVSLDELCAHAGYTRGAFYVHFKNRDELTLEVMTINGENWLNSIFRPQEDGEAEDLFTMVQRFLTEMVSGTYPITQKAGLRPHQLLAACARNEAIKKRYLELVSDSIRRLTTNVQRSQNQQQLNQNIDPEQIASLLLGLAIGVHTMYDLDYPIDFAKGSMTLLQLLAK